MRNRRSYLRNKEKARGIVRQALEQCNRYYGFSYGRVSIKDQRTRWGSCSAKGNLNFNYRVVDLPQELVEYLVVHELCHLKELNHSAKFWDLVALTVPDYRHRQRALRSILID